MKVQKMALLGVLTASAIVLTNSSTSNASLSGASDILSEPWTSTGSRPNAVSTGDASRVFDEHAEPVEA